MNSISFPEAFLRRVESDPFYSNNLLSALESTPETTVRNNPLKGSPVWQNAESIAWCENAFRLTERPDFTLDPHFHAGAYYVQEAGSMVLDQALRQLSLPECPTVLDLCAAPGGKSTLLLSFLAEKGILFSNEIVNNRALLLAEMLTKWGSDRVVVTNNKPSDFTSLVGQFDLVLVDAPCSGEGMFRKLPHARSEWSERNVELCALRQTEILRDIWPTIAPGGYLIYSTCTFNASENEEQVERMMQHHDAEVVQMKCNAKPDRKNLGYYCIPGEMQTEGFYFAVLKKVENTRASQPKPQHPHLKPRKNLPEIVNWWNHPNAMYFDFQDKVLGMSADVAEKALGLSNRLRIIKWGTTLGKAVKNGWTLDPALALHHKIKRDLGVSIHKDQALRYLKNETFPLQSENGYQLLLFEDNSLGWIKQMGYRFNNLWPKEWKIRKNILHD